MQPLGKPKPLDQTIVLDFKPNQQKLSLNHLAFAFMLLAGNTFFFNLFTKIIHPCFPLQRDINFLNYPLRQLSKKDPVLQSFLQIQRRCNCVHSFSENYQFYFKSENYERFARICLTHLYRTKLRVQKNCSQDLKLTVFQS